MFEDIFTHFNTMHNRGLQTWPSFPNSGLRVWKAPNLGSGLPVVNGRAPFRYWPPSSL